LRYWSHVVVFAAFIHLPNMMSVMLSSFTTLDSSTSALEDFPALRPTVGRLLGKSVGGADGDSVGPFVRAVV
jgi:hypothetical protein